MLDATRISDGAIVSLKRVGKDGDTESKEVDIAQLFSSETLAKDKRNHCAPVYDVLKVPGRLSSLSLDICGDF